MDVSFSVSGVALTIVHPDRGLEEYVRREMDPYEPLSAAPVAPDIRIERTASPAVMDDLQGDAGDGFVTGVDDGALYILERRGWWALRLGGGDATIAMSEGLPPWRMFGTAVRPLLQLSLHRHGAVAVHASSVEVGGAGVVVAGWSESGKTETVLALMEGGARFVTDKWTVVSEAGRIAPFPAAVFVRRWVLEYLPRLAASLPLKSKGQLGAGRVASAVSGPVRVVGRRSPALGHLSETFDRAVPLLDRVRMSPRQLRAVYGQAADPCLDASLGTIALLTTTRSGPPEVHEADPRWAAGRLARSGAFERRGFYQLLLRQAYGRPADALPTAARDVEHETQVLERLLSTVRVLEVRAPFPTDPRRVADEILRAI